MKAQELRLGNWILDITGNPVQVRGLTKNGVWIGPGPAPVSAFKPVPLTEEWLLKFGFEKIDEGFFEPRFQKEYWNRWGTVKRSFEIGLHQIPGDGESPSYNLAIWLEGNTNVHLHTVHSLQNLFHSITGEELTITE